MSNSTQLPPCGYAGNSDVYGVGIRVGMYLQWISSILSKLLLDKTSLHDLVTQNTIFHFAIFLVTILLITNKIDGVHDVDILIMLHIFFGNVFIVFFDHHTLDRISSRSSKFGILFKWGTTAGMAIIGVWFWDRRVKVRVDGDSDQVCVAYAFLLKRVELESKDNVLTFKTCAIVNLVLWIFIFLWDFLVRFDVKIVSDEFSVNGDGVWGGVFLIIIKFDKEVWSIINLATFIYSIIAIELLIKYNDITDIYMLMSTGQIIPFTIGMAGLTQVLWKIYKGNRKGKVKPEESLSSETAEDEQSSIPMQSIVAPPGTPDGSSSIGVAL